MKSANPPATTRHAPPPASPLRTAILAALEAVEGAKQRCIYAGQMLLDEKTQIPHGEFHEHIARVCPEVHYETCRVWMRAAGNISKALPPMVIDVETVSVSQVLAAADADLTPDQRKYKQAWFEFTADKTIKQCLDSVTVYGEPAHRVDRAVNGKIKGGVGMQKDRKAFEKFTAIKLGHITTFLTVRKKSAASGRKQIVGWRQLSPVQQNAIGAAFTHSLEQWPAWLLEILADKIKTESRMSDAERLSR
jgi:hypothetical protein